jgi:uncharacterized membrane protein
MRKCFTILLFCSFLLTANNLSSQNPASHDTQEASQRITFAIVENRMTVFNAPYNAILSIYSLVGIKVVECKITQSRQDVFLNLPVGYYIVKIGDQTSKIAIRN